MDNQAVEPGLGIETAGANVTNFTNPPLPQEEMPANPCKGIGYRRPYDGSKCSLSSNPMCFKLQERFLKQKLRLARLDSMGQLLQGLLWRCCHPQARSCRAR